MLCLLCPKKPNTYCAPIYIKNNLLCLYPFYFKLRHNFGGNSTNVNKLFILQKKTVRILSNMGARESCEEAFKNLEIMTLHSQYIFSLIIFTVDNKHLFTPNNEIHRYSTRNNSNLHLPTINLSKFYKGPYISGTKAFNHLSRYLKLLVSDVKRFKIPLKRFLYHHSFY